MRGDEEEGRGNDNKESFRRKALEDVDITDDFTALEVSVSDEKKHVRAISELSNAFSSISFDDDLTMNVSSPMTRRKKYYNKKYEKFIPNSRQEESKEEIRELNGNNVNNMFSSRYSRNSGVPSPNRLRFDDSGDHTISSKDAWSVQDENIHVHEEDLNNFDVQVDNPPNNFPLSPMSTVSIGSRKSDPGIFRGTNSSNFMETDFRKSQQHNNNDLQQGSCNHFNFDDNEDTDQNRDHHRRASVSRQHSSNKKKTFGAAIKDKIEETNKDIGESSAVKKVLRCLRCSNLPLPLVASWIVRHAPCFWCCFCLKEIPQSSTDRIILIRLNYLCAIFSIVQIGVGIFISIILFDPQVAYRGNNDYYIESIVPNLWTLSGMILILAFLGIIILCVMIFSRKAIRHVNLQGSIRYMWVLYWIVPLEILFVISLFDYHEVTEIWVRHYWTTPSMAWFREVFCVPRSEAHGKCMVPFSGGQDFANGQLWCLKFHNETDCESIRDTAENKMNTISYAFFTMNAVWGACLVVLLIITLAMLQGIISTPVVQRSKEANVPTWLTFPTILSFSGGCVFLFSPSSFLTDESGVRFYWIGISYMTAAGTFLFTALLGWFVSFKTVLNAHDIMIKRIGVNLFILFLFLATFAVGAIFTASIIYSLDFVAVTLDDKQRGSIACAVDSSGGCSNCPSSNTTIYDYTKSLCPEWSQQDVVRVMQSQLKQSASLGAIFLIYALSALRFAFALRSHINAYQIEYI